MARSRESTADPLDLDYDAVIQVKDDTSIERDREYVPTQVYSCSTSLTRAVIGTQLKQFWGIALSKMYRDSSHGNSGSSSIDQANMDQGKILYHVKWEGLENESDRTWETEENFL